MAADWDQVLTNLKDLWKTRDLLEENGPNSPKGAEWLAEVRAYLELADPSAAAEFKHLTSYIVLPLSGYTLDPLWTRMQGVIRAVIIKLEAQVPRLRAKAYGSGEAFNLYQDLSQVISAASTQVFIVEPYANEELFDIYLSRVSADVRIRVLTGSPSSTLRAIAAKFAAGRPGTFEARHSNMVHDRVIFIDERDCWVLGQSLKDAAMKKPTYLVPLDAVSDMGRLYEDEWTKASKF